MDNICIIGRREQTSHDDWQENYHFVLSKSSKNSELIIIALYDYINIVVLNYSINNYCITNMLIL